MAIWRVERPLVFSISKDIKHKQVINSSVSLVRLREELEDSFFLKTAMYSLVFSFMPTLKGRLVVSLLKQILHGTSKLINYSNHEPEISKQGKTVEVLTYKLYHTHFLYLSRWF